jgi:hypothetical protein
MRNRPRRRGANIGITSGREIPAPAQSRRVKWEYRGMSCLHRSLTHGYYETNNGWSRMKYAKGGRAPKRWGRIILHAASLLRLFRDGP